MECNIFRYRHDDVSGCGARCPLARLFDTLLELCVDNNGRDSANTTVISFVLDAFNDSIGGVADNVRARRIAQYESARLALCTLDV